MSGRRSVLSSKLLVNRLSYSFLVPGLLLVVLGLAAFFSLDTTLFKQQLVYLIFSLVVYIVFLNIDYHIFGTYSRFLYIGMILALALLFIIGFEAKGAIRWFEFFGLKLQFSEIIKPFYIIFLAHFLSTDKSPSFIKFIKVLAFTFPIFFLILKQPDLGNAIIFFMTTFFILFSYGFPISYFIGLGVSIALPLPFLFNFLHGYQKQRLLSFIGASGDPLGSSYNAIQALISIGSGGFFGKGFGQATQSILKFLPERHTDFIFASITESLGFMGGVLLIGLYGVLLYNIYKLSRRVDDQFSYLVVSGCFFLLMTHIFFNMGMNLGILPIVGITLPFVSYGGSSLLTNFIILGIVSSVNFEFKKRHSIEIR